MRLFKVTQVLTWVTMCSFYRPGSASLYDSVRSNSESWIMSQQSGQVLIFSEEIYPSAIRSSVSSHGQKYSPQCLHLISMVSIIKVHYPRNCNNFHPL